MLTALTWTHPVHGTVTEQLCPAHELLARRSFADWASSTPCGPESRAGAIAVTGGAPGRASGAPIARPAKPQPAPVAMV